MMNPIATATRGKGVFGMLKRAGMISGQYGFTYEKMDRNLDHFASVLERYGCGATFPITAIALARTKTNIANYQNRNIEFAVHGLFHVDQTSLSKDKLVLHFERSRKLFDAKKILISGFRCPYLRWNSNTILAVQETGFLYEGSQGLYWDVLGDSGTSNYYQVLKFYGALPASAYPSLPYFEDGLIRIPYCLPDDEALIDRIHFNGGKPSDHPWQAILEETYHLGELFTLGLHPERIHLCEVPLREVLDRARQFKPAVWIARLDEIAHWWKRHFETKVIVFTSKKGEFTIKADGPTGTSIILRNVEVTSPAVQWDTTHQLARDTEVVVRSSRRPFIGVSRSSAHNLKSFLRGQGYIVEEADNNQTHTLFLDQGVFVKKDERPLLALIEQGDFPLVRIGRWPYGARSALSITGDIDAVTIWDYGLRFLGR
jgi:peptidoglycan/xylan/chitin deacetylase (PgdA/CDA1 family)